MLRRRLAAGHVLSDPVVGMSYFPLDDLQNLLADHCAVGELRDPFISHEMNWTGLGWTGRARVRVSTVIFAFLSQWETSSSQLPQKDPRDAPHRAHRAVHEGDGHNDHVSIVCRLSTSLVKGRGEIFQIFPIFSH